MPTVLPPPATAPASDPFAAELAELRARSLHRRLREMAPQPDGTVAPAGGAMVNFASNDYLGLAGHPALRAAAKAAIDEFGVGAGASRLVCGTLRPHRQLEEALAGFKGTEAALAFSSGYAAAHGVLGALAGPDDVLLLDKLVHASWIDAARASRAVIRVFPHNHLGKLESLLAWARAEHPAARRLVVTESVFSMDGDRAPLRELVELKRRHGALLVLDEAHAVGVCGPHGRGLAHELGVTAEVDALMGTLSKALGVAGGYVAGRRSLIDLLVNRARSFVFSTAPPPALAAAGTAALEVLASDEGERLRQTLWQNIRLLGTQLPPDPAARPAARAGGRAAPASAIFPWIVGSEAAAMRASAQLAESGYFAPAIRWPTVPRDTARLRLAVSARHTPAQIASLGEALRRLTGPRA